MYRAAYSYNERVANALQVDVEHSGVLLSIILTGGVLFFFFKQKRAYEGRISDWSSDVCPSDLVALDVTDRASVDAAVARIEDELGPIQILVNNAGVAATAPFLDMTEQDWAQVLDTNLTGVWRVGQAVARRMAPLGRGSIINISSMALLQRLAAVRSEEHTSTRLNSSHSCASR